MNNETVSHRTRYPNPNPDPTAAAVPKVEDVPRVLAVPGTYIRTGTAVLLLYSAVRALLPYVFYELGQPKSGQRWA